MWRSTTTITLTSPCQLNSWRDTCRSFCSPYKLRKNTCLITGQSGADAFCCILFTQRYLIYAVLWSFSGDGRLKMRAELGEYIRRITTVPLPSAPNVPIIDYEVKPLTLIQMLDSLCQRVTERKLKPQQSCNFRKPNE